MTKLATNGEIADLSVRVADAYRKWLRALDPCSEPDDSKAAARHRERRAKTGDAFTAACDAMRAAVRRGVA